MLPALSLSSAILWFAGGRRCVGKPTGRKIANQPVGEWNMIRKGRALQFGGASVLAIMAASTLMPSLAHATCLALPSTVNDIEWSTSAARPAIRR